MLTVWRLVGWGRDDLEMWTVGYPGQEAAVSEFGAVTDVAVLVDNEDAESAAYMLWAAHQNDVFVIDREGFVAGVLNISLHPLSEPENRTALDALVLGALAE
jgi:hypothetical protein